MSLNYVIKEKIIDAILNYETENECTVDLLDEEDRRIDSAIQEIVAIIEAGRKRIYPSDDDKMDAIKNKE